MTMITPSYLGETIEYSSLHACRSTLEDPIRGYLELPKGFGAPPPSLLVTIERHAPSARSRSYLAAVSWMPWISWPTLCINGDCVAAQLLTVLSAVVTCGA